MSDIIKQFTPDELKLIDDMQLSKFSNGKEIITDIEDFFDFCGKESGLREIFSDLIPKLASLTPEEIKQIDKEIIYYEQGVVHIDGYFYPKPKFDYRRDYDGTKLICNKSPADYAYKKTALFTENEMNFFQALRNRLPAKYYLLAKVRLGDLFNTKKTIKKKQFYYKIAIMHVDFVIIDIETLKPTLLIELDDKSHYTLKNVVRDAFVNSMAKHSYMPMHRVFSVKSGDYSTHVNIILNRLEHYTLYCSWCKDVVFKTDSTGNTTCNSCKHNLLCPECGEFLIRRQSSKSDLEFIGCTGYPDCKYIDYNIT